MVSADKLSKDSLKTIEYVSGTTDALLVRGLGGVYSILSPATATVTSEWTKFGTGLPNIIAHELNYDAKADLLTVGTLGRGVWTVSNVKQELANPTATAPTATAPTASTNCNCTNCNCTNCNCTNSNSDIRATETIRQ